MLSPYDQTLFLLDATILIKVIIRSAVLAIKLHLITSTGTGTNAKILQQFSSANMTQPPSLTNTTPSQQLPTQSRDQLIIIQWNANGIRPKLLELHDKMINLDSDIVATPQSKLQKADKTPSIEGCATIHKDPNNILGSGLLFFMYNGMIFEKIQSLKKAGMEILSIRVHTWKSLWIEIYNI